MVVSGSTNPASFWSCMLVESAIYPNNRVIHLLLGKGFSLPAWSWSSPSHLLKASLPTIQGLPPASATNTLFLTLEPLPGWAPHPHQHQLLTTRFLKTTAFAITRKDGITPEKLPTQKRKYLKLLQCISDPRGPAGLWRGDHLQPASQPAPSLR